MKKSAFCIYVDTVCQGAIPVERDENGNIVVYATEAEAQREIADDMNENLRLLLEDERDFADAIAVEEYVVAVNVLPDGSIVDARGKIFGAETKLELN
jgi:hypothetical protein